MVGFYKHDIPAWMDGTEALSDGAYRAYHVIVQLIMLNEGPITLNERGLAGRCNQTLKLFMRHLEELTKAGKLTVEGGRIANARAARELENVMKNRENSGKGGKISGERRKTQEKIENDAAKPLKDNDADEAALQGDRSLKEKRREEKNPQKAPNGGLPEGWADFWEAYPERPGGNPEEPARRRYAKALEAGATPETLLAAVRLYADQMGKLKKLNTEFVKQARFWLSPDFYPDWIRMVQRAEEKAAQTASNSQFTDDMWRKFVSHWRKTRGQWSLGERSPPPDHVQTKVPRAILAEFNIHPGHQRAA